MRPKNVARLCTLLSPLARDLPAARNKLNNLKLMKFFFPRSENPLSLRTARMHTWVRGYVGTYVCMYVLYVCTSR